MFDAADPVAAEREAARLEAELAEACGLWHATTARVVSLIAQVLATGGWEGAGIRSPEHWVGWKCGVAPRLARSLVAMARRLPELPATGAAFDAGELSEDQVKLVCRHAPASVDAEVAEFAHFATVPQLRRTLSSYVFASPPAGEPGPPAAELRRVNFGTTDDGDWHLSARLPLDEGALVEAALGAQRDRLFAEAAGGDVTWADALLAVADSSLGADTRRRRADRSMVLLHVDAQSAAHLHLGAAVPEGLRRYLSCDTRVRPVFERAGAPVSVGRALRTVPDRTRMVIEERDRGCRVPGCPRSRWLEIHHIVHWERGGRTDTDNLVALCGPHHRAHHHELLGIAGHADEPDGLEFTDSAGRVLRANAPPVPPGRPPAVAAHDLGIPPGQWNHPPGERLRSWWVHFNEPP